DAAGFGEGGGRRRSAAAQGQAADHCVPARGLFQGLQLPVWRELHLGARARRLCARELLVGGVRARGPNASGPGAGHHPGAELLAA
ncbi:unnamed protein product, partial [Effrenium voratum]